MEKNNSGAKKATVTVRGEMEETKKCDNKIVKISASNSRSKKASGKMEKKSDKNVVKESASSSRSTSTYSKSQKNVQRMARRYPANLEKYPNGPPAQAKPKKAKKINKDDANPVLIGL